MDQIINTQSGLRQFRREWVDELAQKARLTQTLEREPTPSSHVGRTLDSDVAMLQKSTTSTWAAVNNSSVILPSDQQIPAQPSFCSAEPSTIHKYVVGVDYGTTFTSVSWIKHPAAQERPVASYWDIKSVMNWPDSGISGSRKQVPSETWYSSIQTQPLRLGKESISEEESDTEEEENSYVRTDVVKSIEELDDELMLDDDQSTQFLWGYAVPYQQYSANTARDPLGLVKRPKTLLLDTAYTQQDRTKLLPVIGELMRRNVIRRKGVKGEYNTHDVEDIITDFLTEVFLHTKAQLRILDGFTDKCPVQFVMTVPTFWSPQSSRILQNCMSRAIKASKFGSLGHGCVDNLFIISEPEAAATYLMAAAGNVMAEETFVILDCGGGTVDAVTYTVDSNYPLRLGKEEVPPEGDNCGASYLNENFKALLERRLRDEENLFVTETLESVVNRLIPKFEDDYKRRIDATKRCGHRIYIANLIGDEQREPGEAGGKRFQANHLMMNRCDYEEIFMPLLKRVAAVLDNQLRLTFQKGKEVKKVFLVGGFGDAPSLRSYLREYLAGISKSLPSPITLVTDQNSVTAVSVGAVLRAHNLDKGPKRVLQSSYGFLRTEPYEPEEYPEHSNATPFTSEMDGDLYVQTIDYFIKKGDYIRYKEEFGPIPTYHTFWALEKDLVCEEILYVSDMATESHYTLEHPKNKGLVHEAGKITTDMTWLVEDKKPPLKPIHRCPTNKNKRFYKVEYDLFAIVEGRNLRYEARYTDPADPKAGPQVQKAKQVSIASAFQPGTQ